MIFPIGWAEPHACPYHRENHERANPDTSGQPQTVAAQGLVTVGNSPRIRRRGGLPRGPFARGPGSSPAIGAYIVTAVCGLLLGVTGLFGKILDTIPKPITAAVLAGVPLPFSIQVVPSVVENPAPAGAPVIGYPLGKRFIPRYAVLFVAMTSGIAVVWVSPRAPKHTPSTGVVTSPGSRAAPSASCSALSLPPFSPCSPPSRRA